MVQASQMPEQLFKVVANNFQRCDPILHWSFDEKFSEKSYFS
jgi:hypothetical protein